MIYDYLINLKNLYEVIYPTSDWYGDILSIEYLLMLKNLTLKELTGTHNMLHVKSFIKSGFGLNVSEKEVMDKILKVKIKHTHEAKDDVLELAEEFVKAVFYLKEKGQKDTEKI